MPDQSMQPPFPGDQNAPASPESSFVFPDHMPDLENRGWTPYAQEPTVPWTGGRPAATSFQPTIGTRSQALPLVVGAVAIVIVIGLLVAVWSIAFNVNAPKSGATVPLVVATYTASPQSATPTVVTQKPTVTANPTVVATVTSTPTAVVTATSAPTPTVSPTVQATATTSSGILSLQITPSTGNFLCPGYPTVSLSYAGTGEAQWSGASNDSSVTLTPAQGKLKAGQIQSVVLSGKATVKKLVLTFTSNAGNPTGTINCP